MQISQQKALLQSDDDPNIEIPTDALRIEVAIPENKATKEYIDRLAMYVAKDGMVFENLAIQRERDDPKFRFLFDTDLPDHIYYRWRVYSIAQGDSLYSWRQQPFQMVDGGPYWFPPTAGNTAGLATESGQLPDYMTPKVVANKTVKTTYTRTKAESSGYKSSEASKGRVALTAKPLPVQQRTEFMTMLRKLSTMRGPIREAMAFCLDNAEKAVEVCEILAEALTISTTKISKRLARLYLVSDVLYNSQHAMVKNASAYRSEFKKHLEKIFDAAKQALEENQLDNEETRNKLSALLNIWREWSLYPGFYMDKLETLVNPKRVAEAEAQKAQALREAKEQAGLPAKYIVCWERGATYRQIPDGRAKTAKKAKCGDIIVVKRFVENKHKHACSKWAECDNDLWLPVEHAINGLILRPYEESSTIPPPSDAPQPPVKAEVDGEPIDDMDGTPMDDIDGEAIDGEDWDGEFDEDTI